MTIRYKFNKSSESKDCVVESVELFVETQSVLNTNFTKNVNLDIEWISSESKVFVSPQQLKDYINTIQEPIEFIAESSIDDVLMKEWIGEWEVGYKCNECFNRNINYPECDYIICCKEEIKTGSPKLNPNWTFKIL